MTEYRVTMSDGATLFVKILGDNTPGKPLLLTHHGAPGLSSHREPETTFAFLQDKFRVIVYDARGSGVSDLKPPYTHERWVADIEELRQWAGAEKFVLAGGSYGGFISLDYALVHQDKLIALILRDTWAWGARGMMQALKSCLSSTRVVVDPERQYRMWTGILIDDADFAAGVAEMAALFLADSPEIDPNTRQENTPRRGAIHSATQNFAFASNMPKFDVRHRLGEIAVPTLVIVGRQDLIAPLPFSEEIAKGIPEAELKIFEHSGHNPAHDEPAAFQRCVLEYVSSQGF